MKVVGFVFAFIALFFSSCEGQNYPNFGKGIGLAQNKNNRNGLIAAAVGGIVGSVVGGWIQTGRLKNKYAKEKKELVSYVKQQDELYKKLEKQWQADYQKLFKAYEELEKETEERDYEEFKAPDVNNDDSISKSEFNTYVRKYLASFPELSEHDFPKFEDFDLNSDGSVSFNEWQTYLYEQKQREERGQNTNAHYNDVIDSLYDQSNHADGFNSLQNYVKSSAKAGVK